MWYAVLTRAILDVCGKAGPVNCVMAWAWLWGALPRRVDRERREFVLMQCGVTEDDVRSWLQTIEPPHKQIFSTNMTLTQLLEGKYSEEQLEKLVNKIDLIAHVPRQGKRVV